MPKREDMILDASNRSTAIKELRAMLSQAGSQTPYADECPILLHTS